MNTSCPPLARSILDVIGRTPLVELTRSVESRGLSGRLLVKLEYFSPGGSKKDRIALEIIREARASGELRPGQTVVELTSGNTGTGLAAWRLLAEQEAGATIAFLACDSGLKYLSTDLFP